MASYEYWLESFKCILDESGISDCMTEDKKEEVAKALELSADMEHEISGGFYIPNPQSNEIYELKMKLRRAEEMAERNMNFYRQNVAKRHNVDIHQVSIDRYGDASISPR